MQRERQLIQRRRAGAFDLAFLEDVHVAAFSPLVLVSIGWPASRVREQFHKDLDLASCQVIVVDGVDAGYVSVQVKRDHWYVDAIGLGPNYQRRGIGTAVMQAVLDDAGALPVRLNVMHINRAKSLYVRLGFRTIHEDQRRQVMEWRAAW